MTQPTLRRIDRMIVEKAGYKSGSDAEDRALGTILRSHRAWRGRSIPPPVQQHRAGRYRLDFAWPEHQIAIEIDGPHHDNPYAFARDWMRDRELRAEGWIILRVSAYSDEELTRAIVAVGRFVQAA